jgi:hypothetical protein
MKKVLLAFTAMLFVGALFIDLSSGPNGHLSLFKKAHATQQTWKVVEVDCFVNGVPSGHAYGCFQGTDASCTPLNCSGM